MAARRTTKGAGTRRERGEIRLLLRPGEVAPFQRTGREEAWHVLSGDPVEIHLIHADGRHEKRLLDAGATLRIAPTCLRAARLAAGGRAAEIARRMAPGAGPDAPEVPTAARILREHPLHGAIVREMTKG